MVSTEHPDIVAIKPQWNRCRDAHAGRDAVLAAGTSYLPYPDGMSVADYLHYRDRASFLPAFGRTVSALAGAILRHPPRVEAADRLRDQLADVTLDGTSLTGLARGMAHEVLTVGRHGVLIDMPTEPAAGARPYWTSYGAEQIVNWRTNRVGSDPRVLVQLVLRETTTEATVDNPFAHNAAVRYRECALTDAGAYVVRVWTPTPRERLKATAGEHWTASDWIAPTRRGEPLTFIPFAFVGPTGTAPDIARPPLLDLADVNLSHYRNSADREHGLFYVALPTPWVAGASTDQKLRIGPSAAWMLSENGRAGMLEFSGAGLGAIERAMKEKEAHMAALGAQMLEPPTLNDTATAVMIRHAGDIASLRTIAGVMGAALTSLTRWHEWWARGTGDIDANVRVDVADDLDRLRVTGDDVKAAMLAVQADLLSFDSFYALLEQAGWTRPGATAADERAAIVAAMRTLRPIDDDEEW